MNVTKMDKGLPKRETFVCDICGYEREVGAFNPMHISKEGGGFMVQARVCREHFGLKDGEIVYTLPLLQLEFEILNKAKELLQSSAPSTRIEENES